MINNGENNNKIKKIVRLLILPKLLSLLVLYNELLNNDKYC